MDIRDHIRSLPAAVKVTFLGDARGDLKRELVDYDDHLLVFQNGDETELVPWTSVGVLTVLPAPEPEVWSAS